MKHQKWDILTLVLWSFRLVPTQSPFDIFYSIFSIGQQWWVEKKRIEEEKKKAEETKAAPAKTAPAGKPGAPAARGGAAARGAPAARGRGAAAPPAARGGKLSLCCEDSYKLMMSSYICTTVLL